jgi:glycosyltransferase involved in cell wall biosynthesis
MTRRLCKSRAGARDWQDGNVVTVLCFTGNSGLTDYSVSLCRSLTRHALIRLVTSESIAPRFRTFGFDVITAFRRTRHYPIDIIRVVWNLARAQRHVILFQGPLKWVVIDGLVARLLRFSGHRVVLTVHDVMPHYPKPWSRLTQRFFLRSFDRLVVHSDRAIKDVTRIGVSAPLLMVPHGTYDIFCLGRSTRLEARRKVLGDLGERTSVLFFGHLESRKGFFEFLSLAKALELTQKYVFVAAGPDGFRSEVERCRAREHASELPSLVFRPGRVPHESVEEYFLAADIVVLPYLEGTTSGVLKIALAFGNPVVATDVGDIRENIPEGGGIVVQLGSGLIEDMAAAVKAVASAYKVFKQHMSQGVVGLDWVSIGDRYYEFLSSSCSAPGDGGS